jgi:hypothetical protein
VDTLTTSGQGSDTVFAEAGNDTITSAAGADTIDAGAGNDLVVVAGIGADIITLGDGIDTVRLQTATTAAVTPDLLGVTITDFTAGAGGDVIDFGDATGADGAIVTDYIALNTGDVGVVTFATGTNVTAATGLVVLTAATAVAATATAADIATRINDLLSDGTTTTTDILDGGAIGDDFLFAIAIADGSVAIVHVEGVTGVAAAATDLDVVVILTGVAIGDLVASNFADFL